MADLQLRSLHKRFGAVTALHALDLEVKAGEFISFLGPSGCGKTTALRIIAGFERASAGQVLVDGHDISAMPANRRDMGMVFQAYSLFPNMTALENVAFGLRVRRNGRRERAQKATELLELVGLGQALGRYPHQLSGGQQQRVALARALAIQPRILLLDEPLSALDAKVRTQLREEIRRIQQELSITTLYVTHDQEEALSVSDRVVVLSQGRIEQVGTPSQIYGDPQTLFVAEFIGTMNRVAGRVLGGGLVDVAGARVPAAVTGSHAVESNVVLLLRPESITVRRGVADGPFGLAGIVVGHTFLGSVTRVQVHTKGVDLVADVGTEIALTLQLHSAVTVSWEADAPRVLPSTSRVTGQRPSSAPAGVAI